MASKRICYMKGCHRPGVGDLNLSYMDYHYDKEAKRTNKKVQRAGHMILCSKHFKDMLKFFANYNGIVKGSKAFEDLVDDDDDE